MRFLHVNHRDIKHPKAGGLEVVVHELCKRLIQKGHEVVIVCSGFKGGSSYEEVEGIKTYRIGREQIFNWIVGFWLIRKKWFQADIVLEYLSKVACFLPVFRRRNFFAHVPHLLGTSIFQDAGIAIGIYVYIFERLIPVFYRGIPFWTPSKSTAEELRKMKLNTRFQNIPYGIDLKFFDVPLSPTSDPSCFYIGRIRKYKGLLHPLLDSWEIVLKRHPEAKLQIIGKGDFQEKLAQEIQERSLQASVFIRGFVSEEEKREFIQTSWFEVYPSMKEGWGLSVIEAAAVGVPVIASDSPGLNESVKHQETGLLVPHGDVQSLADAMIMFIEKKEFRLKLGLNAKSWSQNFNWDLMADRFLSWIDEHAQK